MTDCTPAGHVSHVEGVCGDGISRLLLALLYHVLDDIHVDRCSKDRLQLLFGRFAQETLAALVGEEYLKGYEARSDNR